MNFRPDWWWNYHYVAPMPICFNVTVGNDSVWRPR